MDMIADRLVEARERGWQDTDREGRRVDRTLGYASRATRRSAGRFDLTAAAGPLRWKEASGPWAR
jgi:hypothetical protein